MPKYTVYEAEVMMRDDMDAMRKEYTRMRDIAQKRIKRMGQSEFADSKTYQSHASGFKKLKDIDLRDLAKAFSDLSKFVNAKGSSIAGQREIRSKTINTWREQGLNLNPKNYNKVIKIMEEMRRQKITYGSDKAVELADSMLYLDDRQTNDWLDNLSTLLEHTDEIHEMISSGYVPVSIDELKAELGW